MTLFPLYVRSNAATTRSTAESCSTEVFLFSVGIVGAVVFGGLALQQFSAQHKSNAMLCTFLAVVSSVCACRNRYQSNELRLDASEGDELLTHTQQRV